MASNKDTSPPRGVKRELLEYLHLEFGETASHPGALRASDLKYVGARKDGHALLHFWEYPSGSGKSWATARVTNAGYELSTSLEGLNGERNDPLAALRVLIVEFGAREKGQKRIPPLRLEVSDLDDGGFPVKFPTGEEISFYAEVYPPGGGGGPDVSVQILQDGEVVFGTRCTSGIVITLQLAGYDCLIRLGTGPWES